MFKELDVTATGNMIAFQYLAKHRAKLPFWDAYPLALPFDFSTPGSMLSLNVHYLPVGLRGRLFDSLLRLIPLS